MAKGGPTAAFFDLDKTLISGDAGVLLAQHIHREWKRQLDEHSRADRRAQARRVRGITRRVLWKGLLWGLGYKMRIVKRSRLVAEAYTFFCGMNHHELVALAHRFYGQHLRGLIYPEAARRVQTHHAQGHHVVLLTSAMALLARPLADELGADHLRAVHLEERNGVVTGGVTGPLYGADKAHEVRLYAQKHGIDLAASYAYTDHYSDHHLLAMVGHPCCVNPNPRLERLADRRGWPVIRWDLPAPGPPGEKRPHRHP